MVHEVDGSNGGKAPPRGWCLVAYTFSSCTIQKGHAKLQETKQIETKQAN